MILNGEVTGYIMVTLNPDPDTLATYQLGTAVSGVITVWDDDAPELAIVAGEPVIESDGAVARFTVSVMASPNREVTIHYTVTEKLHPIMEMEIS